MDRVLICVIGQIRADKLTWDSFNKNLKQILNADLALCIGDSDANNDNNQYWKNSKYKFITNEYDDFGVGYDQLQLKYLGVDNEKPDWRVLLNVKDQWLGGIKGDGQHPGSAGILLYFRAILKDFLVDNKLVENYDWFIITRSDFIWLVEHPGVEFFKNYDICIPYGEHHGGITDRHIVIHKKNVIQVLSVLDKFLTDPIALKNEMIFFKQWNLELFLWFYISKFNYDIKYMPYVMYSVRTDDVSTRWSQGVYNHNFGYYLKYPDEFSRALISEKIYKISGSKGLLYNLIFSNLFLILFFIKFRKLNELKVHLIFCLNKFSFLNKLIRKLLGFTR